MRSHIARKHYLELKDKCDPDKEVLVESADPNAWFRFEKVNRKDLER